MAKESSFTLKICDFITKYSIYALIFLVPIFFLPQTSEVLDCNKQALLVLLVFISLFSAMLKVLVSGKFEIRKNLINTIAGIFFLIYALATIFSVYRCGSFWGQPQQLSESMITAMCFLLFYFLVSNIFSKKDIFVSVVVLSFSAVIAELIGVLQLLGLFVLPFAFTKSLSFNLIGSVGSLGFFAAILLPLATAMLIVSKKWWKVLFILQIILSGLIFVLVNYPAIWWVVMIGSALLLVLGVMKRGFFDGRWMSIPMFFLVASIFLILLNPLAVRVNEFSLSYADGFKMGTQAIKERPIFGSGPGTFAYDFSKFKEASFNKGNPFWNTTFGKSYSKVLNDLATLGIFGLLSFLALMCVPIYYGIKFLVGKNNDGPSQETPIQAYSILLLGLTVALVEQCIVYFIYNSNISLDLIFFFTIASLVAIISENKKEYVMKQSSVLALIITFSFTLIFVFAVGLIVLGGQRYVAEVNYVNGLINYQNGKSTEGLQKLEIAGSLNPNSDLYFRQLSQAYLLALNSELQNSKSKPSDSEQNKIQVLLSNAVNSAKRAKDLNPTDPSNWSQLGYIYQNLVGISGNALTWAIDSYESALKLDPNNPSLFFQEGSIYLDQALSSPADQRGKILEKSRSELEKAVSLNHTYSNAIYSLGIVYSALDKRDEAINAFTVLQQLNPTNTDIPKILSNLKAGNPILQIANPLKEDISSPTSTTNKSAPAKESSSSSSAKSSSKAIK